jgi:hypothetical protein
MFWDWNKEYNGLFSDLMKNITKQTALELAGSQVNARLSLNIKVNPFVTQRTTSSGLLSAPNGSVSQPPGLEEPNHLT